MLSIFHRRPADERVAILVCDAGDQRASGSGHFHLESDSTARDRRATCPNIARVAEAAWRASNVAQVRPRCLKTCVRLAMLPDSVAATRRLQWLRPKVKP